jgi:hypothetical protein
VLREHPAHDIFIDLDAEGVRDLLGNALIAESGVTKLHFDNRCDECRRGTLRARRDAPQYKTARGRRLTI